jgi:hypothetical protein
MTFRGSDAIPGPTVSFKDPDGPDNKKDGVADGGPGLDSYDAQEVALNLPKPVRPNKNTATGWLYPDKPGIE